MEKTYSEILSDLEKAKIVIFNNDPVMKQAVRKVLLSALYNQGTLKPGEDAYDPKKNFALLFVGNNYRATDEEVGRMARSAIEGALLLETGFKNLEEIKEDVQSEPETENRAL